MKRILVLEDGSYYEGQSCGSNNYRVGKLIFNTAMTGYQEVISDLAYEGEIVVMTYPLIGAYGINYDDQESLKPSLFGLVVKDISKTPSNFRKEVTIDEYLKRINVPGIYDIDTRSLVKKIRDNGPLKATFCDKLEEVEETIKQLKLAQVDYENTVSTKNIYPIPGRDKRVIIIDFGAKLSLLRLCAEKDYDIIVVPYDTDLKTILSYHPEGILLTNGPGNPENYKEQISVIKELMKSTSVYGIGLGCELIALACGAKVLPLPYGHHGNNLAVTSLIEDKVVITSQNHNYQIDIKSLKKANLNMIYQSLNDGSCEGISHKKYKVCGIEFDPNTSDLNNPFFASFDKAMGKEEDHA